MKSTFIGSMILAGGLFTLASCSNDAIEDTMEETFQGIQPGTPMNFVLGFGGQPQESGKRKIVYNDAVATSGSVDFKWEVGDCVGIECPDAEKDNEELGRQGRGSKGVYKVKSADSPYGPHYATDLQCISETHLYWSKEEVHRVFLAYPAGKVDLGTISGDGPSFTRPFTTEIEQNQDGDVFEDKIRVGNSSVDGYRCIDKNNSIFAGEWTYYRSDMSAEAPIFLPLNPFFTALDVVFQKAEGEATPVKIKSVSIKVELPEEATIDEIKIAGKCSGTVQNSENGSIIVNSIVSDATASNQISLSLNQKDGGYKWNQDKPLSAILCMFPWPEPEGQGDDTYQKTFPVSLKVVYQYEGEEEQTKYLKADGKYGINARNRILVPTLPKKAVVTE